MGLTEQLLWWKESWAFPMIEYVIEQLRASLARDTQLTAEIHLVTHIFRHDTGYPDHLDGQLVIPILPEWLEFENDFKPLFEYATDFWDKLYEEASKVESLAQILKVTHYNASNLISVKSIDLALALFANDCKDDLVNWEFYDRYYDMPGKRYFPEEYPSFAPMVVNQLLNTNEELNE